MSDDDCHDSALYILRAMSRIVADTGDFDEIEQFHPYDATTNPSLILQASLMDRYKFLLDQAVEFAKTSDEKMCKVELALEYLYVLFGVEILKIVSGRVSTEVDARLSFDINGQIAKARRLVGHYQKFGYGKDRVYIKLSSTWEGIQAALILERDYGIHCNLTLMFSLAQAMACADANVSVVSPFVGRILDWHLKRNPNLDISDPSTDPGVRSVTDIYNFYRQLAGCDMLTISPKLLDELSEAHSKVVERKLLPSLARATTVSDHLRNFVYECSNRKKREGFYLDESAFRWSLNEDEMATEKLSEGIRKFSQDAIKLESFMEKIIHGD